MKRADARMRQLAQEILMGWLLLSSGCGSPSECPPCPSGQSCQPVCYITGGIPMMVCHYGCQPITKATDAGGPHGPDIGKDPPLAPLSGLAWFFAETAPRNPDPEVSP